MAKYAVLFLCLMLAHYAASAQTLMNVDSLLRLLPTVTDNSQKVDLYINIGQQYEGNEPGKAAQYYIAAGELSKKTGNHSGTLKFISNYTYLLNVKGAYDSSLLLNLQAVDLARSIGDSLALGKALFNTGTVLKMKGEIQEATSYYLQGQQVFEQFGNEGIEARVCDILQLLYLDTQQYERAVAFGEKSVRLSRKLNDSILLATALSNLGMSMVKTNRHAEAKDIYREALNIAQRTNNKYAEEGALLNMADLMINERDLKNISPYFEKAIVISRQLQDGEGEAIALRGLAIYAISQKQFNTALTLAMRSLHITDSLGIRPQRHKTLATLSNIHFALHNIETAEEYARQSVQLSDSLSNETIQKNMADLEKKYETVKKDTQLLKQQHELKQQSQLNYLLIAIIISFIAIGMLVLRNYAHHKKLREQRITELEQEKQLSAAEAVLKGEEQERSRLAKDLHDGLGGMLSGIKFSLENIRGNMVLTADNYQAFVRTTDMLDNSMHEMRRIAHNMMPENLLKLGLEAALGDYCHEISASGRLGINLQVQGVEAANIPQSESIAIYRIIQELVNNIMKHAAASHALVQVMCSQQLVSITVEDDGIGFDATDLKNAKGIGWSNIQSRVAYLNGTLDLQSAPGEGTSVYIEWVPQP